MNGHGYGSSNLGDVFSILKCNDDATTTKYSGPDHHFIAHKPQAIYLAA